MTWSSKDNAAKLLETASKQHGFFTASQAKDAGYDDAVHGYHVTNGDWEKHYRGIYRLTDQPLPDWPELLVWSLWSRDRAGETLGVYTHDTAGMIQGTIPKTSDPLHMTVPKTFRRNAEIPDRLILHKEDLDPELVEHRQGYAVLRSSPRTSAAALLPYDRVINAGED